MSQESIRSEAHTPFFISRESGVIRQDYILNQGPNNPFIVGRVARMELEPVRRDNNVIALVSHIDEPDRVESYKLMIDASYRVEDRSDLAFKMKVQIATRTRRDGKRVGTNRYHVIFQLRSGVLVASGI